MIAVAALSVGVYLAGLVAAPAAGWQATAFLLRFPPSLLRRLAIAGAEACVGMGTGVLAVVGAQAFAPERVATAVAAAALGVAVGVQQQIRILSAEVERNEGAERATFEAVRRVVLGAGAGRILGAVAVLVGILVAVYGA